MRLLHLADFTAAFGFIVGAIIIVVTFDAAIAFTDWGSTVAIGVGEALHAAVRIFAIGGATRTIGARETFYALVIVAAKCVIACAVRVIEAFNAHT